ncbi:MAG: hypothetical protein ACQEQ1_10120, partial [Pseudomonadota bacterium]
MKRDWQRIIQAAGALGDRAIPLWSRILGMDEAELREWKWPFMGSVGLHLLIVILAVAGWDSRTQEPEFQQPQAVQARVVEARQQEQEPEPQPEP